MDDNITEDIKNLFRLEREIKTKKSNRLQPNFKNSDTWKVQLTIVINFISSKDNDEDLILQIMN